MAVDETTFGNTKADELSESELEQYGVWVKSAPEDLDENGEDSFQLEDFSVDELEDSARSFLGEEGEQAPEFDEDIFDEVPVFSDEEEDLLAELERSDPSGEDSTIENGVPSEDSFEFSGGKSYALDIEDSSPELSEAEQEAEPFGTEHDSFDDIEQEFNAVEPATDSLSLGGEFEVPDEDAEFSSGDYPGLDLNATSLPGDDDEADDYDDIQIDLDHDSSIPELELDEQTDHGVSDLTPDEEQLLRDAEDSIEATEKDDEMDQAAYRLLEQIQQEITGIKEELHEVREDIADIRAKRNLGTPETAESSTVSKPQTESSEEASGLLDPGFFEEDEDETIALTGDELDNILNTADFVETTGEPTPVDDAVNESSEDSLGDTLDEIDIDDSDLESDFDISFEQETSTEPDNLDEQLPQEDIIPLGEVEEELEPEEAAEDPIDVTEDEIEDVTEDDTEEITIDITDDDEIDIADEIDIDSEDELNPDELAETELDIELSDDLDLGDLETELDELESGETALPPSDVELEISEPPIEEISIDDEFDTPDEDTDSNETPAGFPGDDEAALELEPPPIDRSELDTLAQLDIDSELADIDELKDSPDDTFADTSELEDISIAFPDEEADQTPADDTPAGETKTVAETELEIDEDEFELDDELDLEQDTIDLETDSLELEDDELDEVEISEDELDDVTSSDDELDEGELELDADELEIEPANEDSQTAQSLTDTMAAAQEAAENDSELSDDLREEIRAVLRYMDQLLESLPEDKIQEFASSEHFEVYKKLFEELGLET